MAEARAGPGPEDLSPAVEDALARLASRLHRIHEDVGMLVGDMAQLRLALGVEDEDAE